MPPGARRAVRVVLGWALALAAVGATTAWGMTTLRGRAFGPADSGNVRTVHVRLPNRPAWMPSSLAREIAASCIVKKVGFYDRALARRVYAKARANPWVQEVRHVRKILEDDGRTGVIEVDCRYRKPAAKVLVSDRYGTTRNGMVYVDDRGAVLPWAQAPKFICRIPAGGAKRGQVRTYASRQSVPPELCGSEVAVHYPVIRGVVAEPPAEGSVWHAEDLATGLRLLALIAPKPYADQITVIDVRNYAGRIDPQDTHLRMVAQVGRSRPTKILFGRFPIPNGPDYVVSPARKISFLDKYAAEHGGRLAGLNDHIKLQYDPYHVSFD
jgi:hypothetical protein